MWRPFLRGEVAQATKGKTPLFSRPPGSQAVFAAHRRKTKASGAADPRHPILNAGGVCLDSVRQWWLRLLRVFPVCDSEPGSVFGLIIGDPDPVTPSRIAWFPFATVTCDSSLPPPPHTALVDRGRTASQTGQWPWQGRLRAEENQAEKSPRCADQEALRKPPGTAENQAETGVLAGPPSWLGGGSLQPTPSGPGTRKRHMGCPAWRVRVASHRSDHHAACRPHGSRLRQY